MRKRDSKRRWKARIKIGRRIPREAIVRYRLALPVYWREEYATAYWMLHALDAC